MGTRVPDVALSVGRLHETLRGGRFVRVTPRTSPPGDPLASGSGSRQERLAVATWTSDRRTTVLVRPDGHVAWVADDADTGAVEEALTTWLGAKS